MLKHGILGLLSYGDKTGYEITELFKQSLNYFWTAQTSQIYRELQALEKHGFATATVVPQTGKPDKKVFSITEQGYRELQRWLMEDKISFDTNKPMLMKVFFMGESKTEENLAFFYDLKSQCESYLKLMEPVIKRFSQEQQDPRGKAIYWRMTEEYGRKHLYMTMKWIDECIKELEDLQ